MKKFLAFLFLLPAIAFGGPYDIVMMQRNPTDTGQLTRTVAHPAGSADGISGYNGGTQLPVYFTAGSNLSISSGIIDALPQSWGIITGKPTFSPVATSGAYADLTGKPVIPAAQVQTDWNATAGAGVLLNKPATFTPSAHTQAFDTITATPTTLAGYGITDGATAAQLATKFDQPSGTASQYLRGDGSTATFPTIPAAQVQADWNASSAPAAILNKPVLFSGAYNSLTGIPSSFTPSAHNQAWSTITATPTTLNGYGITDALTAAALSPYATTVSVTAGLATKFNTPAGTTTQYVRGDGSLATLPTAKRIETYVATTDANGLVTVTYPTAFPSTPSVQPGPPADSTQSWVLVSSTTTGFSVRLVQRSVLTVLSLQVLAGIVSNVPNAPAQVLVVGQ